MLLSQKAQSNQRDSRYANLLSTLLGAFCGLFFFYSPSLYAQSPSASLSWTLSTNAAVTSQNVYRAPCNGTVTSGTCSSEGAFAKLPAGTAISPTLATFTDSSVTRGQSYSYYVTAVCPASGACVGESLPSNHYAASIPGAIPPPPTGLSITSVAMNNVNGQDRFQANWTDSSGATTAFTIFGAQGQVLKQASQTTANGIYSYAILIPVQNGAFSVCDAKGCTSQAFAGI